MGVRIDEAGNNGVAGQFDYRARFGCRATMEIAVIRSPVMVMYAPAVTLPVRTSISLPACTTCAFCAAACNAADTLTKAMSRRQQKRNRCLKQFPQEDMERVGHILAQAVP